MIIMTESTITVQYVLSALPHLLCTLEHVHVHTSPRRCGFVMASARHSLGAAVFLFPDYNLEVKAQLLGRPCMAYPAHLPESALFTLSEP